MDISASQYNSAGESSWTHYLDHSSLSENYFQKNGAIVDNGGKQEGMVEEEEEDLSMVSDASSGPPHYHDDDDCSCENWYPCLSSTSQYTKESQKEMGTSRYTKESKKKKGVKECDKNQQPSQLDDTASSHAISCIKKKVSFSRNGAAKDALNFSHGFSAARIKPNFQKHFSFFECSLAGKQASEVPGGFDEEERK